VKKIVFLAANDPIYLPSFFERVLSERARSVAAVFAVPPLYKGQSSAQAAWRYFRTFGAGATVGLVRKLAGARRHGQSIEAVCARYGVPYELIELPELGCLNIHGAILPAYRGVMPSFWMLANGEPQAGVTIFFVNEDIDAGDVCGQRIFEILSDETLDGFLVRSKAISADLLLEVLADIENGVARREPLDLSAGSYFSWPTAEAVDRFRTAGRKLW
jgi:Formyl transferase